jgi:hypothetical protein
MDFSRTLLWSDKNGQLHRVFGKRIFFSPVAAAVFNECQ